MTNSEVTPQGKAGRLVLWSTSLSRSWLWKWLLRELRRHCSRVFGHYLWSCQYICLNGRPHGKYCRWYDRQETHSRAVAKTLRDVWYCLFHWWPDLSLLRLGCAAQVGEIPKCTERQGGREVERWRGNAHARTRTSQNLISNVHTWLEYFRPFSLLFFLNVSDCHFVFSLV